jgi:hypothetical protein
VPWYPKAILFGVIVLSLALLGVRPLRQWALRVHIRWLVPFHLIRFVGIYSIYLYVHHELPYRFAVLGGAGDIAVATLALFILLFVNARPAVVAWNVLGLVDILAVAATASRSELAVPGSMHQLDRFPLILLPTIVVPAIIVTHLLMLFRLLRAGNARRSL